MSLQRQHFILSYLNILSVVLVRIKFTASRMAAPHGSPAWQPGAQPTELPLGGQIIIVAFKQHNFIIPPTYAIQQLI